MCVWAHACLHGTILAIKEGRHSKLKTMIKEGMSASRRRRGRITHCGERTKKCECARCYPMRRRSSDQRYVAYSLTLKRDEKTLMNRHVMNEKHHNTTTISRPTMTKPFNVLNTKPACIYVRMYYVEYTYVRIFSHAEMKIIIGLDSSLRSLLFLLIECQRV